MEKALLFLVRNLLPTSVRACSAKIYHLAKSHRKILEKLIPYIDVSELEEDAASKIKNNPVHTGELILNGNFADISEGDWRAFFTKAGTHVRDVLTALMRTGEAKKVAQILGLSRTFDSLFQNFHVIAGNQAIRLFLSGGIDEELFLSVFSLVKGKDLQDVLAQPQIYENWFGNFGVFIFGNHEDSWARCLKLSTMIDGIPSHSVEKMKSLLKKSSLE